MAAVLAVHVVATFIFLNPKTTLRALADVPVSPQQKGWVVVQQISVRIHCRFCQLGAVLLSQRCVDTGHVWEGERRLFAFVAKGAAYFFGVVSVDGALQIQPKTSVAEFGMVAMAAECPLRTSVLAGFAAKKVSSRCRHQERMHVGQIERWTGRPPPPLRVDLNLGVRFH